MSPSLRRRKYPAFGAASAFLSGYLIYGAKALD